MIEFLMVYSLFDIKIYKSIIVYLHAQLGKLRNNINHKTVLDNMKDQIVAKLASQCEELYGEALKILQRDNLKQLWDREWISTVSL